MVLIPNHERSSPGEKNELSKLLLEVQFFKGREILFLSG